MTKAMRKLCSISHLLLLLFAALTLLPNKRTRLLHPLTLKFSSSKSYRPYNNNTTTLNEAHSTHQQMLHLLYFYCIQCIQCTLYNFWAVYNFKLWKNPFTAPTCVSIYKLYYIFIQNIYISNMFYSLLSRSICLFLILYFFSRYLTL